MTTLLSFGLLLALCIVLIPVLTLLAQVLLAVRPVRPGVPVISRPSRIAVLIPAHNEEAGLLATLASLQTQLGVADCILVVADNCSDQTATVARRAGVEVVERNNPELRGKGYALDFGMQVLASAPPDVVIIVDADCIVASGAISQLADLAYRHHRPVQALYLMHMPVGSTPLKSLAEFAWIMKNKVRPLGWAHLGWPCQLMGTGMAFPWETIRTAKLSTGHIVEDMKLGVDLAQTGHFPLFCPQALVHSCFPTSRDGKLTQRTRWEHGHLGTIASTALPSLFAAVRRADLSLLAFSLDLCVPPLALLVLMVGVLLGLSLGLVMAGGPLAPLVLSLICSAAFMAAILIGWWRHGRSVVTGRALTMAAFYVLIKIPLYIRFLFNRQATWVRSKRDAE